MSISVKSFGHLPCGCEAKLYTMTNKSGASVSVTNYGGILVSIVVPDKAGKMGDVLLGYDSIEGYAPVNPGYLGALIGRYANRIHNGRFPFHGEMIQLAQNSNGQHLHGGDVGFNAKVWDVETRENADSDELILTLVSADGEENYPGELHVTVTYAWNEKDELSLHYEAVSDKDTICNLTNHSYFNLEGDAFGTAANHTVRIDADRFTPMDKDSIPTGELRDVTGTPFDLRAGKVLADGFACEKDDEQLTFGQGYDHNFVLNGAGMRTFAEVSAPVSGRVMRVSTDLPGVQLYTGNMIDCFKPGKCGRVYQKRDALCLETQFFPDTPNNPAFPSCELKKGEKYDHTTVFAFSVK